MGEPLLRVGDYPSKWIGSRLPNYWRDFKAIDPASGMRIRRVLRHPRALAGIAVLYSTYCTAIPASLA
jgi:hypothetical protein